MTNALATLPEEARRDPIVFLGQLSTSVGDLRDVQMVRNRLALVAAAEAWAKQYGKQTEPILRHALASRLIHERRLGELLDGVGPGRPRKIINGDDNLQKLPDGLTLNASMHAKTLAKTPSKWFNDLVRDVIDGKRRRALAEIYLMARRAVAEAPPSSTAKPEAQPSPENHDPPEEETVQDAATEADDETDAIEGEAGEIGQEAAEESTVAEEAVAPEPEAKEEAVAPSPEAEAATISYNRIYEGDFRLVANDFPAESVSLIFTDPPYGRESLPLYQALADFAAKALLPGGSLLMYAPHYALPQVMRSISSLRYFWTLVVLHSGPKALMREFGIRVYYKPILWYVKGGRYNKQNIIPDVVQSTPEKTDHEWQQSVTEARYLIENLTEPNDLVLDPLAGSATTLIAASLSGRRWIGIEKDHRTAELARQRLSRLGIIEGA